MRNLLTLLITVIVLATSACATKTAQHKTELSIREKPPTSTPFTVDPLHATPLPASTHVVATYQDGKSPATGVGHAAVAAGATHADQDDEAIHEEPTARDPWEGVNRKIHGFNNAADKFVLRPVAVGYDKITPAPVQACVSRFFDNLRAPVTVVNQILQGRPGHAAQSIGRFVVNTTVGIGGLFDPASSLGMLKRSGEDFGQTLATWGWRDSHYLVVPLFGPRTVRDTVSILGDLQLSPIGRIDDSSVADKLQLFEAVDGRSRMLAMDKFREDAFDDYLLVRDAWLQRRNRQIEQDLQSRR